MNKGYDPKLVAQHVPMEPIPAQRQAQFLRPGQLLALMDAFPVAYQPVGTLEWHGRQNPIGCDAIKAERLCIAAAERTGGVVMPPLYFSSDAILDMGHGYARGMDAAAGFELPGSFYQIEGHLFVELLANACGNYLRRGFALVILVSGHNPGIQQNLMDEVCYRFMRADGARPVRALMEYMAVEEGDPRRHSDHAAAYETSMMLHLEPACVNPHANEGQQIDQLAIWGEHASKATAEEGAVCFDLQASGLAQLAREYLAGLISR